MLWGVNASEQNLVHATGVKIPIELQNKSMVVKGSIRAISCDEGSGEHPGQASVMVRAVKATVRDDVLHGRVGCFFWSAPVAFRRVALETPEWTSRDSNHHRQSVSAGKTNAIPTEPSGRLYMDV